MKRILIPVIVVLLSCCTPHYPAFTELQLDLSPQQQTYFSNESVSLRVVDMREKVTIVEYHPTTGDTVSVANIGGVDKLVLDHLSSGFQEQGLNINPDGPAKIVITLEELLVKVTRASMIYSSLATTKAKFQLQSSNTTLTKNFSRQATKDTVTRPHIVDLEYMINDQLSDIVEKILNDREIRDALQKL